MNTILSRCISVVWTAAGLCVFSADLPQPSQTVAVPMRDGVGLATDVYLPGQGVSFPIILTRTPYNKTNIGGIASDALRRGYGLVAQDVRGRYASQGENLPFDQDVLDGSDTADWLAKQPWCNGRIGTWGGSAGAITQLQLASSGNRHITCQHLVVGGPSLFHDVVYNGGVFRKSLAEDWLRISQFSPEALKLWVSHSTYDDYWKARDTGRRYRRVDMPAVHIGGYWDIFAQGTIDAFNGYQKRGGPGARGKQKLVMGPWTHGVYQEKAGELTFPNAKKPPVAIHDAWRWFDHWLKDVDNGIDREPAVAYYVIGDVTDPAAPGNCWRTADTWPPLPTRATRYYLRSDRSLASEPATLRGDPLEYVYDPRAGAPTVGGVQLTLPAGPMDQSKREACADVLVFTSVPVAEPMEVTGRVGARLWIASDSPDTDFHVMLCDVYPDGKSYNVCEGRLRARFRRGFEREHLLKPGRIYPLDIDLWSTSVIFNRGHRLRVQVASCSVPGYDPNPNTGARLRADERVETARNQVYVDARHPSHLVLPVVRP